MSSIFHKTCTMLKRKCHYFDEIFIIGCTGSCCFFVCFFFWGGGCTGRCQSDNLQLLMYQWWKFHQNYIFISVTKNKLICWVNMKCYFSRYYMATLNNTHNMSVNTHPGDLCAYRTCWRPHCSGWDYNRRDKMICETTMQLSRKWNTSIKLLSGGVLKYGSWPTSS